MKKTASLDTEANINLDAASAEHLLRLVRLADVVLDDVQDEKVSAEEYQAAVDWAKRALIASPHVQDHPLFEGI